MKKAVLLLLGAFSIFLFTSTAFAISLVPGPYEAKYNNFEGFFDNGGNLLNQIVVGAENKGIFSVTNFFKFPAITNPVPWYTAGPGEEVTGYFYDIIVSSITPTADGFDVLSTGGQLDLYLDNKVDFDGTVANATNGQLMVSFEFIAGIIPGDLVTTVNGSVDVLTNPLQGSAFAYLAVIPGSGPWDWYFDGNAVPGVIGEPANADALIQSNFISNNTGVYEDMWSLVSFDPVKGEIVVPEPATMLLLGSGLIGLCGFGRRKFFKKG